MAYSSDRHLQSVYNEWIQSENVEAIIINEKKIKYPSFGDAFIVVVSNRINEDKVKCIQIDGKKTTVHFMTKEHINGCLEGKEEIEAFYCLVYGAIIYEREGLISNRRKKVKYILEDNRMKSLGEIFSKVIKSYKNTKDLYNDGKYIDSYTKLFQTIQELAEFSMVSIGAYFDSSQIEELKLVDVEVYKLFEELVTNKESLEKRIELLLIAIGYIIAERSKEGIKHLLNVLDERKEWKFSELFHHPELINYGLSLGFLLDYLAEKKVVEANNEQDKIKFTEIVFKKNLKKG